jgi:hypothetical protein
MFQAINRFMHRFFALAFGADVILCYMQPDANPSGRLLAALVIGFCYAIANKDNIY